MTRVRVIATLREHETELRAAGAVRLSVFGSTARGDRPPDSDNDLLAAFVGTRRIFLLEVAGIELRLARLMGHAVDLVEEGSLKPHVDRSVSAEALHTF
jgi:predicted nucleotidyltransferase